MLFYDIISLYWRDYYVSLFKGQITEVRATHITLEVNNIGYMIKVSNPYQFQVSEETTIYLHYHIREDAHELYGFKDATTLDLSLIHISEPTRH